MDSADIRDFAKIIDDSAKRAVVIHILVEGLERIKFMNEEERSQRADIVAESVLDTARGILSV